MSNENLIVQILKEIRDEVRQTNAHLDQTNERLDQMRIELAERIGHVEDAVVEAAEEHRAK